jgi:hypothetical protein
MAFLADIQEAVEKKLIEDYDASPHLAAEAAAKVTQDDVDEYPNVDELTEYVHDNQDFWDD